jgi:hypothetical protein
MQAKLARQPYAFGIRSTTCRTQMCAYCGPGCDVGEHVCRQRKVTTSHHVKHRWITSGTGGHGSSVNGYTGKVESRMPTSPFRLLWEFAWTGNHLCLTKPCDQGEQNFHTYRTRLMLRLVDPTVAFPTLILILDVAGLY